MTGELISDLTRCSGNALDSHAPAIIRGVVHDVAMLALEMATQCSHLTLQSCRYGDMIQSGEIFRDEDADKGDGAAMMRVDLMTSPGLLKLGNGREDLTSSVVLCTGGFVPLRSEGSTAGDR